MGQLEKKKLPPLMPEIHLMRPCGDQHDSRAATAAAAVVAPPIITPRNARAPIIKTTAPKKATSTFLNRATAEERRKMK